jgi:CheY-like chemotaxis protein
VAVRALVVDDSPVARRVLRHRLEKAGFDVVGEAGSAHEALQLFRTLHPLLVTLDLLMPVMEGIDARALFRTIRGEDPNVAVVVISAHPKGTERAEFIRKGALAYFQKPFNIEDLLTKLDRIFPR